MIADLKPYPKYRESGLPWLGDMPEHWVIKRAKSIFECVDVRSNTGKEELLTVSSSFGVIPRKTATVTMFKAESYVGYKLCWPGDLVINSLWAWAGGLGVSRYHGIISTAYGVYRIRKNAPMISSFVNEVMRSSAFNWELQVRSKGIWISRLQLTDLSFLDAPVHIPPPDEQAAIVRFLGWANGQLEKAIRAKRKVIMLLNEQKQVIIHRAVTRGLDPSVPLKPSGTPWLGDIPQHWDVRRLRQLVNINPSKSESNNLLRQDEDVTFLPMEKVGTNGSIDSSLVVKAFTVWNGFTYFRRCDVIVAKITPCFENGKGSFLEILPTQAGFGSTEFHVLRPGNFLLGAYLRMITSSKQFLVNGTNSMTGSAGQQRVPTDFIKNYPIALPPTDEQTIILKVVGSEISDINITISRFEREIELLREYRTRLVADVVTGKLDVREAAAKLPDEALIDLPDNDSVDALEDEPFEEEAIV